jgi:hypothetical protein
MTQPTPALDVPASPSGRRGRRFGATAVALLVAESVCAALGHPVGALSGAALLIAPGLALIALLPRRLTDHPLALAAAVPTLGLAATTVAFITITRVGIALNGVSARAVLLAIVLVGLWRLPFDRPVGRPQLSESLLLGLALAAGVTLQARVLHGFPVPGNDWAKYLLYADEIRRHGHLLIENPYWMLGVPFREDPGTPALYGAFLTMTGAPASILVHGIWVFAVLGILSMFAFVRAVWGPVAGGIAALLDAVLPINQDILGWHGLANVAALALMPLVLLGAVELLRGRIDRPRAAGFALLLVGLAATHRLSATVAAPALLGAGVVALAVGQRREILRGLGWTAVALVALGAGVVSHLISINRTFGGTQGYQAYLGSKLDLHLVALDLTWPFCIAAGVALAVMFAYGRDDPGLGLVAALLLVVAGLAYSWLLHIPMSYLRMAYYLPLALVPMVGAALVKGPLARRARLSSVIAIALAGAIAVPAWSRARDVRSFYLFTTPSSLRGLDRLASQLRPGEPVVTDRCWSFLATWLLHTPTLPALYPEDIQPKAELPFARQAQSVLDGTPSAVVLARRRGIRFVIVDPTCVDPHGRAVDAPLIGDPVYVSTHLVALELPPDPRGTPRP